MLGGGEPSPSGRPWLSATILAVLIFVIDYGLVFWAEQYVASGIAAVMLATIPAFTALSEALILRTQRITLRLASALLIGIAGVAVPLRRPLAPSWTAIGNARAVALLHPAEGW